MQPFTLCVGRLSKYNSEYVQLKPEDLSALYTKGTAYHALPSF